MLIDGIELVEGSDIANLAIDRGPTFPLLPNDGEMFYLDTGDIGFHVYDSGAWKKLGTAGDLTSHISDQNIHITASQNTLLDGLSATYTQLNTIVSGLSFTGNDATFLGKVSLAGRGDIIQTSDNTGNGLRIFSSGTSKFWMNTIGPSDVLSIYNSDGIHAIKLDLAGNATFGSNVSVANTMNFNSSSGSGLNIYGGAGTNQWDMYLNGANIRFSDNTGGGIFEVDTNAKFGGLDTGAFSSIGGLSSGFQVRTGVVRTSSSSTASSSHHVFYNPNAEVGSIRTSGTSTAYNTSSDYRLKENDLDISDGITRVKALRPIRFNFISDNTLTVDGFLAHEAQAVVPEAVHGVKDEMEDDLVTPKYQGIDQSKMVPLLTAALKESILKNEALVALLVTNAVITQAEADAL